MAKDYYATLGISKDADEDAIKQAYKKMALKWHPDRNLDKKEEAERRFKEIGEAFEVLSDKQKRAVYDQYGEAGLKGGVPMDASGGAPNGFSSFPGGFTFSSTNADDIFRQFFSSQGINDPFSSGPRSSRSSRASMGGMGGMHGMGGMPGMGGMGGMPGGFSFMDVDSDGQFGGQPQADHLTVKKRLACSLEELYTGVTKKMKVTRRRADGTSEEKVLTVNVKPGWKSGTKITFNGEGDEIAPSTFQNIVFTLEEKPHSTFKRDGNNLITTLEISLGEALAGFSKTITTLDNRQIPISSESIIEPNTTKRIPNEGMPISKSPGQKGDLIVQFKIRFPRSLTTAQKQQIRSALL